jgi:hypothetical protein
MELSSPPNQSEFEFIMFTAADDSSLATFSILFDTIDNVQKKL